MININSFKREPESLKRKILIAAERVLESGSYILGREVANFENRWAEANGTKHAIGVGNGMDALEISLRSIGVTAGDEVITTPLTAFATALAILRTGATPKFADINPRTGLLCINRVREALTPRTKAIVLVHLYGHITAMDEWHALCEQNGLALVEDCAQAHLAKWSGRVAGSFGVAGAHSFYPTKNLGALGDGGAIITNDDKVNDDARTLRNYGQSVRYHHPEFGLNSRLDELQAAVLTERLAYLKEFTNRRQDIATKYNVEITNAHVRILAMPVARENHVYHLYVVCSPFRDALQRHLRESGVESLIHYPIPVYKQPGLYKASLKLPGSAGASTLESVSQADLANEFRFCEEHTASCVTLPCHPFLSDAEVRVVIEAVNSFTPD